MLKIYDESFDFSRKKGNGRLRREVWIDEVGSVVRYNLAYINLNDFSSDNGRVLGYDNAHGYHHRHFYGKVEPIKFTTFEQIESLFEAEVMQIRSKK